MSQPIGAFHFRAPKETVSCDSATFAARSNYICESSGRAETSFAPIRRPAEGKSAGGVARTCSPSDFMVLALVRWTAQNRPNGFVPARRIESAAVPRGPKPVSERGENSIPTSL